MDVEELPAKDHLLFYCEGPFEGGMFRGAKLLSESPPTPAWPCLCSRGPVCPATALLCPGLWHLRRGSA